MVCSSSLHESLLSRVHFLPDHLKYNVDVSHVLLTHYYRPQTKFGQGNIFTGVCLSPLDRHPWADTPPRADPLPRDGERDNPYYFFPANQQKAGLKPDTPINVYTRFCLNTAKSKFSLVSPVADW